MKNVKPTIGISFGLPHQGGGGYPINFHSPNPLVNPYGGSVGAGGINLGLVSVNPLVSVQVTKDDYGEKIVKPFINLHVTPNDYLVHKLEDLLTYKKGVVYNKHQHYHQHHGHHKYGHYKPHYHHGPPPPHIISHKPFYSSPPIYPQAEPEYEDDVGAAVAPSYYDDPLNYGGGYDTGYGGDFFGRAADNLTDITHGNPLLKQYQNYYNEGQNLYANAETDDRSYDTNVRRGKSIYRTSNPIRFPTSRKRRDVTDFKTTKSNHQIKVRSKIASVR